MAAIVILGILLTTAARLWSFSEQRDKEAELLYIGDQYRLAIANYYAAGRRYPPSLQDLLQDSRSPTARHYLRQLYRDPMTGEADWDLILDPASNGIMGVASKSKLAPIKRRNFPDIDVGFADTECYCNWKFIYVPRNNFYRRYSAPGQGQNAPAPAVPALPPACDPSSVDCTPPPSPQPPRTPPRTPPPNNPFPNWPPRTH